MLPPPPPPAPKPPAFPEDPLDPVLPPCPPTPKTPLAPEPPLPPLWDPPLKPPRAPPPPPPIEVEAAPPPFPPSTAQPTKPTVSSVILPPPMKMHPPAPSPPPPPGNPPLPPVLKPFCSLRFRSVTVPAVITNKRLALFPSIATDPYWPPSIVTLDAMVGRGLARTCVPMPAPEKTMVSPTPAEASAFRNDPAPESVVAVTVNVAPIAEEDASAAMRIVEAKPILRLRGRAFASMIVTRKVFELVKGRQCRERNWPLVPRIVGHETIAPQLVSATARLCTPRPIPRRCLRPRLKRRRCRRRAGA